MRAVRRTHTEAEWAIRRELFSRGRRYRVDRQPVPTVRTRADLVFPRQRLAVYVDGCFWHRCPLHGTEPKTNAEWWKEKLDANVARDRSTDAALAAAGWRVLRVWEHESPLEVVDEIERILRIDVRGDT